MPVGRVLFGTGARRQDVYFPVDTVIAPLIALKHDAMAQIAMIGNEGAAGLALFVGGEAAADYALVQCPGHAFRLNEQTLRQEYRRYGALFGLLQRYSQALLAQMSQTIHCHANHPFEQRLCGWLLLTQERLASNQPAIDPQVIDELLGAPGERVRESLNTLESVGAIQQVAGRLIVRDRQGLERASCECYSTVRGEFARLMPRRMDKLIDDYPGLTSTLINGLSASTQLGLITQLQSALVRAVSVDPEAGTCTIALEAEEPTTAAQRESIAMRLAKRTPIECQYWANLDTDRRGRITAIEIVRPPAHLREEITAHAHRNKRCA